MKLCSLQYVLRRMQIGRLMSSVVCFLMYSIAIKQLKQWFVLNMLKQWSGSKFKTSSRPICRLKKHENHQASQPLPTHGYDWIWTQRKSKPICIIFWNPRKEHGKFFSLMGSCVTQCNHTLSLRFFHDFNTCALADISGGFPLITRLARKREYTNEQSTQ